MRFLVIVGLGVLFPAISDCAELFKPYTANCIEQLGDNPAVSAPHARDSEGRTWKDLEQETLILDPVAEVFISLDKLKKMATVTPLHKKVVRQYYAANRTAMRLMNSKPENVPAPYGGSIEPLGQRRIDGFLAQGFLVEYDSCSERGRCFDIISEEWVAEEPGLNLVSYTEVYLRGSSAPIAVNHTVNTDVVTSEPDPTCSRYLTTTRLSRTTR